MMRTSGQHFLLTREAKSLSLAEVFRMSDAQAETLFRKVRWPDTKGAPVCPVCGSLDAYDCRRPSGAPRFRCRACKKDFSITSGTLFASHKLPLRMYLAAIAIFCNEVKGKSMLALSRDLGLGSSSRLSMNSRTARRMTSTAAQLKCAAQKSCRSVARGSPSWLRASFDGLGIRMYIDVHSAC